MVSKQQQQQLQQLETTDLSVETNQLDNENLDDTFRSLKESRGSFAYSQQNGGMMCVKLGPKIKEKETDPLYDNLTSESEERPKRLANTLNNRKIYNFTCNDYNPDGSSKIKSRFQENLLKKQQSSEKFFPTSNHALSKSATQSHSSWRARKNFDSSLPVKPIYQQNIETGLTQMSKDTYKAFYKITASAQHKQIRKNLYSFNASTKNPRRKIQSSKCIPNSQVNKSGEPYHCKKTGDIKIGTFNIKDLYTLQQLSTEEFQDILSDQMSQKIQRVLSPDKFVPKVKTVAHSVTKLQDDALLFNKTATAPFQDQPKLLSFEKRATTANPQVHKVGTQKDPMLITDKQGTMTSNFNDSKIPQKQGTTNKALSTRKEKTVRTLGAVSASLSASSLQKDPTLAGCEVIKQTQPKLQREKKTDTNKKKSNDENDYVMNNYLKPLDIHQDEFHCDVFGQWPLHQEDPFRLNKRSMTILEQKSDMYKKNFSMIMRKINKCSSAQEIKDENRDRLKHFIQITSGQYIKQNQIYLQDFNTYEYEPPKRGCYPEKVKKEKKITFQAMGKVQLTQKVDTVDNMVQFTKNCPNTMLKRWQGTLNIEKAKLTSQVPNSGITNISDDLEKQIIKDIREDHRQTFLNKSADIAERHKKAPISWFEKPKPDLKRQGTVVQQYNSQQKMMHKQLHSQSQENQSKPPHGDEADINSIAQTPRNHSNLVKMHAKRVTEMVRRDIAFDFKTKNVKGTAEWYKKMWADQKAKKFNARKIKQNQK